MKYFAVFAAVCICVLADTLNPPPVVWCSFGVDVQVSVDGVYVYDFSLDAMRKKDTLVATFWQSDSEFSRQYTVRGDLMDSSKKIPIFQGKHSDIKRDSEQCSVKYYTQDQVKEFVNSYAPGMLYPFEYKTKEDEEIRGIECVKYCSNDNECLYVRKNCDDNCLFAHTYVDEEDGGEQHTFEEVYAAYYAAYDMSYYYSLSEVLFSGCDEGSGAYTEPENICYGNYTPEQPYCAYSVEMFETSDDDPTHENDVTLYIMMKDDTIVGAYEKDDEKGIIRGDLMGSDMRVPVALGDLELSRKCRTTDLTHDAAMEYIKQYAYPILFPFTYEGDPEDAELDGTKCDKYCYSDTGGEQCLYVKQDCKKGCVVGASFSSGSPFKRGRAPFGKRSHPSKRGSVSYTHFTNYKELKDMSAFALNKEKYPGCDEDSYAYEAPEEICKSKSAGSMVKSVAVVVIAAVLVALF